ncbi:FAD-dependent oxidoreductase [Caulobacter segnis]
MPLLAPMSEVAGRIAVFSAAETLLRTQWRHGPAALRRARRAPARVAVLGGGVVGSNAARMAAGLGAEVVVLERSIPRMRELDDLYQGRILTRYSTFAAVEEEILEGRRDHRRGADRRRGRAQAGSPRAPEADEARLCAGRRLDRPGRLLRDLQADHPCRADLCGRWRGPLLRGQHAGRRAAHLVWKPWATPPCRSAWPWPTRAWTRWKTNVHLARGLNVLKGELTHPAVAEALGKTSVDPYGAWK